MAAGKGKAMLQATFIERDDLRHSHMGLALRLFVVFKGRDS